MIKRSFIYNLHRRRDHCLSRHARNSANILSRVTKVMDNYPLPYRIDIDYPYHLIVNCNRLISVHANGFNNKIEVAPTKNSARYERAFMTPKGAVNYILRKWGKNG